jgi:YfiH family protein
MSIEVIIPDWPAPPHVRAMSTLRAGGVSTQRYAALNLGAHVGDDPALVMENRRRLRESFDLPAEPVWLTQVHGVMVADLDADLVATGTQADAAISQRPDRICAVLTADCLPVLLTDREGTCVAAAHAGWRGLLAGVLEATVRAMRVPPQHLLAWLGPAIGPRHFEVGAEVREQFMHRDPAAAAAFIGSERFMADLYLLARQRLRALGVASIYGGGECTFADSTRFFSHRRDQPTGRQATLIWRTAA